MIVIAHFVAISFYIAAAALAALPFARRVAAPVNGVIGALAIGLASHAFALLFGRTNWRWRCVESMGCRPTRERRWMRSPALS